MPFDIQEAIANLGNLQQIAEKDYRRVLEFFAAFVIKDRQLATDEAAQSDHRGDAFALANKWGQRMGHVIEKIKKNPVAYAGSDPFPSEREAVRVFLEKWNYAEFAEGAVIVEDMG
jgi:hypothetical protein